ncbi:hypothetical protein FRB96_003351 [Tulasnella sp. 330]|nr:hypothetical protein FRB96_003351 [Tulasnella sp. 330]KAG8879701.1 hypothetical protein FRB97_001498 [Tulasnella sp. 331]KAG8885548.1 hypothetical protein FRB98_001776 [Tulasnella sp. 332]
MAPKLKTPQFPHFSYPITRDVHWRVEPLVYLVALLVIAVLIPLNYALTGYEVVPGSSSDYNYVPNHWYYRFAARPKPGSHCDPYKFTIGDSFVTTAGIFTYQLAAVLGDGSGDKTASSISYKGTPLQSCDVSYMSAISDARLKTASITAGIACTDEANFPVVFTTSYDTSDYTDGEDSTSGKQDNYGIGNLTAFKDLGFNVTLIMDDAGSDLFSLVNDIFANKPSANPAFISISTDLGGSGYPPWWCSATASTTNATCKTAIPQIPLSTDGLTLLDVNGGDILEGGIENNYTLAITNAMQTMLAAVRIDLGNILPNNILVNRSSELVSTIIAQTFPADSHGDPSLYSDLIPVDPTSTPILVDVTVGINSTQIALEYQCRVEQRKSPGSIVVAVSVATLTLFKSGWAAFLVILTFFAKRAKPEDCAACPGHEDYEARLRDLERQLASPGNTPHLEKLEKEA